MRTVLVKCPDARRPHTTRENVMMRTLVLGVATLALSAGAASAQVAYPGYGYAPYGYGYSGYGYGAAAPSSTSVVIVPQAPAYAAPPVVSGYYGAPVVSQPIYDYAPDYGYGYTPGYWNRGYWGRWYR
jgi:ABC-type arginine transport system permease subunit